MSQRCRVDVVEPVRGAAGAPRSSGAEPGTEGRPTATVGPMASGAVRPEAGAAGSVSSTPPPGGAAARPGWRVIVTRPVGQAGPWVDGLRAAGIDAVALPLIDIGPAPRPAEVDAAWGRLADQALVFFVSANAVEAFFARRPPAGGWPAGTRAAAPGPGTASALRAAGVPPHAVVAPAEDAERFDSEEVWALLRDEPWAGRQVLVVRGEDGRDWLADRWRAAGATVDFVAAYARRAPTPDAAARRWLAEAEAAPQRHLWLFSSSEAVRQLVVLAPALPPRAMALATHPRIAQAAREAGFVQVRTCEPRLSAVRQALRQLAGEVGDIGDLGDTGDAGDTGAGARVAEPAPPGASGSGRAADQPVDLAADRRPPTTGA